MAGGRGGGNIRRSDAGGVPVRVKDAMTTDVISVRLGTNVAEIVKILMERRISGVPVVDDARRVVGVVTEGDLMQRAKSTTKLSFWRSLFVDPETGAATYLKEHGYSAAELMSQPPICASEDLPLGDAVQLMQRHRINRLPVVRHGVLVGILTRADVLRALASGAEIQAYETAHESDAALESRIQRALGSQPWVPIGNLTITAEGGRVRVQGIVASETIGHAVARVVQEVPGVTDVETDLAVVPVLPVGI